MRSVFMLVALVLALPAGATVQIEWVTVDDPGNAPDPLTDFGQVETVYRISKFEITNAQYAEFLNAVAATDPNSLYDMQMFESIEQSGVSGSFTYSVVEFRENLPVVYVTFYDSLRFANWMNNGQPTGPQNTTTQTGAYTFSPLGITNNTITRNPGAKVFLTSEDEWYKAAYYDPNAMIYFEYPASSNQVTACALPGPTPNTANCQLGTGLTAVGGYTGSSSPNGTFDQGGNVLEWNEAIIDGSLRGVRGGSAGAPFLNSSSRLVLGPSAESFDLGFRIASVPEPGVRVLQMMALLSLAILRKRRAPIRLD